MLRNRWSRGEYYVGEWHSHPGGTPDPSSNDLREMQAISREVSYRCPKPIMIIAGTLAGPSVTLSVSVLENDRLIILRRTLPNSPFLDGSPVANSAQSSMIREDITSRNSTRQRMI
jgi:hypothetical protein